MAQDSKIQWTTHHVLRFWSKVEFGHGCWLWKASATKGGYGVFAHPSGTHTTAHRIAYELAYGVPDPLLQVDHLCRNRMCVNPRHLELVTNAENTRRGLRGELPAYCKRGHKWEESNVLRNTNGRRQCKKCRQARDRRRRDASYWREYRAKRKAING